MSKSPSAITKKRILFACAIALLGFCVLIGRLVKLQIIDSEEYQLQAAENQLSVTKIAANRGAIYDSNGNKLAMSTTAWNICVNPSRIKNDTERELIVAGLSEILGVKEETVRQKCEKSNLSSVEIKKRVDKATMEEVTTYALNNRIGRCIHVKEDVSRKYPYENFAASVIGFVNSEYVGSYGLESYYDDVLSGTPGKLVSATDSKGHKMPFEYDELYSSEDGNSVYTTIDEGIQYFVEKHLELAVKEHNVQERAACIAMDPNTGKILGMATKGDFDPNSYTELPDSVKEELEKIADEDERAEATVKAQYDMWRNKAISDPYEPGSVFKILTLSAALDSNTTTLNDHFTCIGYANVADRKIGCWQTHGHGEQSLSKAVQNSCNPAFIQIGQRMGIENFQNYFEAFGLTEKTNVDLPGEATSIYHAKMTEMNLASCSFGQTFKVTPIQLITAVCAAVNGGYLYEPYVVEKIVSPDGSIVEEYDPTLVRQVISEETSEKVRTILGAVVSDGSGRTAAVPGYKIGGKTGTSEKLDQVVGDEGVKDYVSSFLAVAPADDPQIVILLLLDEAQMENPYGSVVAAPVVGAMLADILPYMGIEPHYTEAELEKMTGKVKNVTEQLVHDAMTTLRLQGYSVTVSGEGTHVIAQSPEAGSKLAAGGTITLYTDASLIPKEIEVPDVEGMSVTEVNNAIIGAGLKLKLIGVSESATDQVAYTQSPAAGEMVMPGTIIEVSFTVSESKDEEDG